LPRALPFVDRTPPARLPAFPWKLVVAAIVVLVLGIVAARSLLQRSPEASAPAPTAAASAPAPAAVAEKRGRLVIESQPSGAKVTMDGAEVGTTPLKLDGVEPGRHTLVVATDTASVRRNVRIEAGKLLTVDVPVYSGWVSVFAPISLQVAAGGRSLGSTETGKIMLPPGRHTLTLSNRDYGFSETRTVEIHPGEERPLNVEPMGRVNINAHPWAEVWVDGKRAGETPIANLQVLLGTRVFTFKHPLYGERRVTSTITSTAAALSVDFTKP
jgi:serine/threonine-protein kinase